jgi:hypothetical protein
MSTQVLADVLIQMMEDDKFHVSVINKDPQTLADLSNRGLTQTEIDAVTMKIERWEASLLEVANMGAWKLITQDLGSISEESKKKLNTLLAQVHTFARSIPVTGS